MIYMQGRVLVPFRIGNYQESRLDAIKGQADLLYHNGTFYLAVTLDVPEPEPGEPQGTLGIDLGIVNLATDSTGESFSGTLVEANRNDIKPCANAFKSVVRRMRNATSRNSLAKKPGSNAIPTMSS